MIDLRMLSSKEREWVVYRREAARDRRDRNREAGACVNENKQGTHGKATHGVRCKRCWEVYGRSR